MKSYIDKTSEFIFVFVFKNNHLVKILKKAYTKISQIIYLFWLRYILCQVKTFKYFGWSVDCSWMLWRTISRNNWTKVIKLSLKKRLGSFSHSFEMYILVDKCVKNMKFKSQFPLSNYQLKSSSWSGITSKSLVVLWKQYQSNKV